MATGDQGTTGGVVTSRRTRTTVYCVAASTPVVHRIRTPGRDWELALDALAAVEPAARTPLRSLVAPRSVVGAVPELVVVTSRPHVVADAG